MKYLICHVTSQNHVIERGSSSWFVTTLPILMAIDIVEICFKFVTQSSKTTWLKGQVTITIGAPQNKLPPFQFRWSRDLARPRDQSFIWFYGREPLMASYHLAKFGGHRYFGVGDMFLVVEGQDSTCRYIQCYCLPLKHIACHAYAYEISARRYTNVPACPMKDPRFWSQMSTRTTDGSYFKNSCQSVQRQH